MRKSLPRNSSGRQAKKTGNNAKKKRHQLLAKPRYFTNSALSTNADNPACQAMSMDSEILLLQEFVDALNCSRRAKEKIFNVCRIDTEFGEKAIAALMAASKAITEANGRLEALEYFASLCTMLTGCENDAASVASILFLLKVLLPSVQPSILVNRFSQLSELLYVTLSKFAHAQSKAVVKQAVVCLGLLLKVQPDHVWESSSTVRMFDSILLLVDDESGPVRRAARKAVLLVLSVQGRNGIHPVAEKCFEFCNSNLRQQSGNTRQRRLNILQLLLHVLDKFSRLNLRTLCAALLLFISEGDLETSTLCMVVMKNMFRSRPDEKSLTSQLNAELIMALYDCKPVESSEVLMVTWLNTMTEAHLCLCGKDQSKGKVYALNWIAQVTPMFHLDSERTVRVLCGCLSRLTKHCFTTEDGSSYGGKILQKLDSALKPVSFTSLRAVGNLFEAFYSVFARSLPKGDLENSVHFLADLRENSDNKRLKLFAERVIGFVVRYVGPDVTLQLLPLKLDNATPGLPVDLSRTWLIQILKRNLQEVKFGFFTSTIMPLAVRFKEYADRADESSSTVFRRLHVQLWSLLPSFCCHAIDLDENVDLMSIVLERALMEQPDAIDVVLLALRKLSTYAQECVGASAVLTNVFSTVCRLYIGGERQKTVRLSLLATLRHIIPVIPEDELAKSVQPGLDNLAMLLTTDAKKANRVFDVLGIFARNVHAEAANAILEALSVLKEKVKAGMMKKIYRVLEELTQNDQAILSTQQLDQILRLLREQPNSLCLAGKAARFGCLEGLIKRFPVQMVEMAKEILVQTFSFGVGDYNMRVKKRCAGVLFAVTELLENVEDSTEKAVEIAYGILSSFLDAAEPSRVLGSLLGFRLLTYRYREHVPGVVISEMVAKVCSLMSIDNLSVIKACLQFCLTFFSSLPYITAVQYLEDVVPSLFKQSVGCARRSRFRTRLLLKKLVRLFSFETVVKFVPDDQRVRLTYVRKALAKEARKKVGPTKEDELDLDEETQTAVTMVDTICGILGRPEVDDIDDSDSDSVRSVTIASTRSKPRTTASRRSTATRFEERDEDDIIDLLDPDLHKHLAVGSEGTKRIDENGLDDEDSDVGIAEDGRIVIIDKRDKRKKASAPSGEDNYSIESGGEDFVETKTEKEDEQSKAPQRSAMKDKVTAKLATRRRGEKLEPYAYFPFDFRTLKRRGKKASAFKGVVGRRKIRR
ncbi:NUC173 domain containing protein [Trichuris trichiura]|uniref:NUC173 domain containing protein n=1 Tax=Trichuris trichiura TaxID=36087 RepID=A0A077Z5C7_TRITR|nr:NUC173 domain containing protein [Trichuris trichiura]